MNLNGLTQLEIEEEFDNTNMKTMLMVELELFLQHIGDEHWNTMSNLIGTGKEEVLEDMFIYMLSILGNEKVGMKIGLNNNNEEVSTNARTCVAISNARDIEVYNLIQAIGVSPIMNKLFDNPIDRFNTAMDIVAEFDTVLFDLHKKTIKLENGDYTTVTYARTELTFKEEVGLRAQYNRFRLPMIETPDDWTENSKGGYKLNKSKVTTNRGDGNQPQECLDVLNKLQRQPYMLVDGVCAINENHYLVEELKPKSLSYIEAQQKADMISLTTEQTYGALKDKPFYFEWKFDFRGRLYSTGYDINLQANKYKKGAIQPC